MIDFKEFKKLNEMSKQDLEYQREEYDDAMREIANQIKKTKDSEEITMLKDSYAAYKKKHAAIVKKLKSAK